MTGTDNGEREYGLKGLVDASFKVINDITTGDGFDHIYVVDTNVVMGLPEALGILAHEGKEIVSDRPNLVVVTDLTRTELDGLKKNDRPEKAYEARKAIEGIHDYLTGAGYEKGDIEHLTEDGYHIGIRFKNGSCIILLPYSNEFPSARHTMDDKIISCGVELRKRITNQEQKEKVRMVSDDTNFMVSCRQMGLPAESFGKHYSGEDYSGFVNVEFGPDDYLTELYKLVHLIIRSPENTDDGKKTIEVAMIEDFLKAKIFPNQFVRFHGDGVSSKMPFRVSASAETASRNLWHYRNWQIERLRLSKGNEPVLPSMPKEFNYTWEQECALELICDPAIDYVALIGEAGTGKTITSLNAALTMLKSSKDPISTILCANPIADHSQHGFVPGEKFEKLMAENANVFDTMRFLLGENSTRKLTKQEAQGVVEDMMDCGELELESLVYVPGRTLHHHFVMLDEAQDQAPQAMKVFLTRVGEDSKVVILGDPAQIKNPHCRPEWNGLRHVVKSLRGCSNFGYLTLKQIKRSRAAKIAAERL